MLCTYQCLLLLIERGNDGDSKTLLRSMLEGLFVLGATVNDNTFAETYLRADEDNRRRLYFNVLDAHDKLITMNAETFITPRQIGHFKKELDHLQEQSRQSKEWKKLPKQTQQITPKPKWASLDDVKTLEIAKRAGMEILYKQHYSYLCLFTHPTPTGMAALTVTDKAGRITHLRVGRNDTDSEVNMRVAIEFLLTAVRSTCAHFGSDVAKECTDLSNRLEAITGDSSK